MRRVAPVLLLLVLTGSACAARRFDTLMQTWKGRAVEDLYTTWGRPSQLYVDGRRGQVVVYVPSPSRTVDPDTDVDRLPLYSPAATARFPTVRIFFVNPSGRIYRSEWRGRWECCSLDGRSSGLQPQLRYRTL